MCMSFTRFLDFHYSISLTMFTRGGIHVCFLGFGVVMRFGLILIMFCLGETPNVVKRF
jgi:Na+-transporting methylmalonyl-CoA/oxaloacetate decarboxylase gamma subunit